MESLVTVGIILVVAGLAVYRLAKKSANPATNESPSSSPAGPFGTDHDPGDENDKRI